jgi:hypothetical protein
MLEEIPGHVEGPSWSNAGRFKTFEEADGKRKELTANEDLQVKVKWMRKNDDFVVKTRADPSIAEAAERVLRREEKKRRKAKLNKKRRKK